MLTLPMPGGEMEHVLRQFCIFLNSDRWCWSWISTKYREVARVISICLISCKILGICKTKGRENKRVEVEMEGFFSETKNEQLCLKMGWCNHACLTFSWNACHKTGQKVVPPRGTLKELADCVSCFLGRLAASWNLGESYFIEIG